MAKKSARSKGYRTYKKEVKGFTEAEKKTMIIGFAVLLLIVICVVVIPNAVRAKGTLKVKDGVVQGVGENWLITDTSTTSKPLYRKIAEVNPVEGYQLRSAEAGLNDSESKYYYYEPVDAENAVADEYYAIVGKGEYDMLCANAANMLGAYATEVMSKTEPTIEELEDGTKIAYYAMEYTINTTMDEENPEIQYNQTVSMYIDSNVDGNCVLLNASNVGEDESAFGDIDAMVELMKEAVKCVTIA